MAIVKASKTPQYHLYEFDTSKLDQDKLKTYYSLVTKIQTLIPECWLMGGAIRDLIYGHEPKDLDFFANILRLNRNYSYTFDMAVPDLFNVQVHSVRTNGPFSEYDTQSVVYQDQDKTFYEFVIKNASPAKVLSSFDFSFNQAACDGKSILVSREFLDTFETKKVILLNVQNRERAKKRVEKFKAKFKDLDFTQPIDSVNLKISGNKAPTLFGNTIYIDPTDSPQQWHTFTTQTE